jgi:HD-GYP domain-containing protein (c-di-GMP phosphodiesterase class II)
VISHQPFLYDELTAASPDRPALSPAEAVENLRGVAGMLLDPAVFAALERVVLERP